MLFRLVFLLPATLAMPSLSRTLADLALRNNGFDLTNLPQGCPTSNITVPVPKGLSVPAGENTTLVTVARGSQNYTCSKGAYISAGALAK